VVIESTSTFGQQICDNLKKEGYKNVSLYKTGEDGLKAIYDQLPHLILLDIVLPDMDGYQVLAKKQGEPLLSKIPVFLLSMQGVAINMRNIPPYSVSEVIISLNTKTVDIIQKVNDYFGYGSSAIASEPKIPSSDKKKLLWIEDDKLIGTILAKKIVSSGFDLVHVKDGEGALSSLLSRIPDVIIVDLILPGMNGFEILEKIRNDERFKGIPTMVLSNLSKVSDIDRAKSLGAKKFLVKASTSLDQVIVEIKDLCK
jgi:DNA-binding response OmpR family regulator